MARGGIKPIKLCPFIHPLKPRNLNNMRPAIDNIDFVVDRAKELYWWVATAVLSVLVPVEDILIVLFYAFLFNIVIGIITDVHVNKAKFSINKAFNAFSQLAFYGACVVFLDIAAKRLDEPDMGITAVKWLTIIVLYFYLTNIFKNARQIFPKSQAIAFIDELLSTELFSRLKNMFGIKKKEEKNG